MGHELDELLWNAGTNAQSISTTDWYRIIERTFEKLASFFSIPLQFLGEPLVEETGFCVKFESCQPSPDPLKIQVAGTYGVGVSRNETPCLQGFVFVYSNGLRLVGADNRNHVYLHYVRADAEDEDFSMVGCTGPFEWRSYGWSVDEYDEFGGRETWSTADE